MYLKRTKHLDEPTDLYEHRIGLLEGGAIGEFCQRNYGVAFPMTEKVSVRAEPHPLWADLARQPGSAPPAWNFSKYLVGGDGKLIARFSSKAAPDATPLV